MSTQLIDFDALQADTRKITLEEAKKEIVRELKARRSAFERWAKAQPSKADYYRKRYRSLAAVNDVLLTMEPEAWNRRIKAAHTQTGNLFN